MNLHWMIFCMLNTLTIAQLPSTVWKTNQIIESFHCRASRKQILAGRVPQHDLVNGLKPFGQTRPRRFPRLVDHDPHMEGNLSYYLVLLFVRFIVDSFYYVMLKRKMCYFIINFNSRIHSNYTIRTRTEHWTPWSSDRHSTQLDTPSTITFSRSSYFVMAMMDSLTSMTSSVVLLNCVVWLVRWVIHKGRLYTEIRLRDVWI